MRARFVPFWISVALHLLVFGVAALALVRPPQFGVDSSRNSMEVDLVAAAPDEAPVPPQPDIEPPPPDPQPDDMLVPTQQPKPPPPTPVKPKPKMKPTVAKGDGSARQPGKDAVTANAAGASNAEPDYLHDPSPEYPESARRNRQEGVVTLQVLVTTEGYASDITVQSPSGVEAFDHSAITAVRKWRFRPAEIAGVKVSSRILVPIRFRLDQ